MAMNCVLTAGSGPNWSDSAPLRLKLHEGVEEQLELLELALLVVLHRELEPQVQRRHLGLQDVDDIVGVIGKIGARNLDHLLGTLHGDEDRRHVDCVRQLPLSPSPFPPAAWAPRRRGALAPRGGGGKAEHVTPNCGYIGAPPRLG